ncbi:hypothetical protein [Candidatus Methylacidiphilum infernorum]|uniref:hypothetical protein n=1 Tax=Candidatus Methylacidiphilum infernorum TaxID=511746 RepID=UPI0011D179C5|nr:hypothetical protein [Candidatus Methylacidiphilum infernorum]
MSTKRLATTTALPVASPSSNGFTATERFSALAGKVRPLGCEWGRQDPSGQEENGANICARF